ncbi:MAG TPA: AAA family ATPase, partial [Chloroflexia bacterium]|nr:AAA family ATPase [Chloroflexia bacterium]
MSNTYDQSPPGYRAEISDGNGDMSLEPVDGADGTNQDATSQEGTTRDNGEHVITDDLEALLGALPPNVIDPLRALGNRSNLLEVVMDIGRRPEARYRGGEHILSNREVDRADLDYVTQRIGEFGGDNRAGIERTLHRISCIRNRRGHVVGLTCRIGRAVFGTLSIIKDLVETGKSILLVGPPGVGKTTILRECARVLADEVGKRVIIVDTSNEIAGDGDIPHPSIGRARRMQVPMPERQHAVMIEGVENHMPEVIIIDEIGTELEAQAARTIAERGVQLVGTAHGTSLENLMLNPTLSDLVGGIQTVTLSDEEARRRGTQKSVLERKAPPTFDIIVEILDRERVAVHRDVAEVVDSLLRGEIIPAEIRTRLADGNIHTEIARPEAPMRGRSDSSPLARRPMGRRGFDDRGHAGLPEAPRRQMPSIQPGPGRNERTARGTNRAGNGGGGTPNPFGQARGDESFAASNRALAPTAAADEDSGTLYDERDPAEAQREERRREASRRAPSAIGIAAHASDNKPLQVYPFGVSRNRLEQAVKELRVPVSIVKSMDDADIVMTLKNYYRKSPQSLRSAEQSGVPVFVLKSNTLVQIESALSNVFNVEMPVDPMTSAMEETEEAI